MSFNSTEEIIEDLRQGRMVIIVDDEDRENEGDLLMVASRVRPEDINFMARFGRGLICLTLTRERCRQLRLPLMVGDTNDKHGTNFTVSIEAAEGVTTGISAYDRAHTVRTAVAPDAAAGDLVQPGHIFPLMAQPGGVLVRAGHTEAGCDLARLAGFEPAAVIVEILNEDGSMARRPDLERFAEEHDLKMGTIEHLIRYRIENERSVERVAECPFPTEFGEFRLVAYEDALDKGLHYAMVKGDVGGDHDTLVRVHLGGSLCDTLAYRGDRCGWPLRGALERIAREGRGVAVIIHKPVNNREMVRRLREMALTGGPDRSPGQDDHEPAELRTHGIGAQILKDLGVSRMRLLSAPKRFHGLGGFGLEVVEYVNER
ncbi:3,4-dihydroxy-2-butanone-4-phosphate synthase [Ectothiorhodospira haloalkaliphila]|uniref:bifunctional 3,4-dihydroxy-2-butanone-4-phosphate synthase/GTP cyclohydrolase II n=1 Tax=Ectothiorhodospira haloalkaliphila TaxID=421628 RepID=UPI001EE7E2E6|nr:bifunctional 3,4-dihydroxy-2-butanone-4-phosphate synthase/GTP cyclohydrolase II [Ectothiorhodospira haloalkaliphila]MCG5524455.1 3,4-dihydroxy-2-butanone-4-phosphate synthase [Ectothiorhodospira haloalkaliphila]